jgi:hypothetical protein
MADINDGGPAFPIERMTAHGILAHTGLPQGDAEYIAALARMTRGMTLRDYFAAKALAFVVGYAELAHTGPNDWAAAAYEIADAMLKARDA